MWRPSRRFAIALSSFSTKAPMYIDVNQTRTLQRFAWAGKEDSISTGNPVNCFCEGDLYDGFLLMLQGVGLFLGGRKHSGPADTIHDLKFLKRVPVLELLHPHTSSLHPVLTGWLLWPYSFVEPAASWIVDLSLDCQHPICHQMLNLRKIVGPSTTVLPPLPHMFFWEQMVQRFLAPQMSPECK